MSYLGAYMGDTQRLLTPDEQNSFLEAHPLTAARVLAFNLAVDALGFDQVYTPPSWYQFDVPIIPPSGLCVSDATYGNVLVAPNAQGKLYYNGFVGAGPCAAAEKVLNDGEYVSPSPAPGGPDWLDNLQQGVGLAWLLILGFGGLYAYNTFKKG